MLSQTIDYAPTTGLVSSQFSEHGPSHDVLELHTPWLSAYAIRKPRFGLCCFYECGVTTIQIGWWCIDIVHHTEDHSHDDAAD